MQTVKYWMSCLGWATLLIAGRAPVGAQHKGVPMQHVNQISDPAEASLPRVFVIGDSISLQYGPYLRQALAGQATVETKAGLRQALADLNHPRGANCGDSSMVLSLLERFRARGDFRPDLLLLNCGLHDIKTDATGVIAIPAAEYRRNLERIVALVREMGIPLVWIRTTPLDEVRHNRIAEGICRFERDLAAYNRIADEVMRGAGVPLLDLHGFTARLGPGDEIFCDHVHFTEDVRARQGAYLAEYISGRWAGQAPAAAD
ncbi:MAG: SGNH/GDSL hydrolase family protein [Candidatus Marinimicrobia bacterium]|nr:SGNH/GDSL hydrolase family protein [Candidatus Neomarinimicrobiota bacterium]